jgi:F-type H+-transporting ATPase subunit b
LKRLRLEKRLRLVKRLLLLAVLAFAAALALHAQEGAAGEAAKEETPEPSAALKWGNFIVLAAGLGYLIGKTVPALYRKRTDEVQRDITEAQAIKKDAETRAAAVDARVQALGVEMEKLRTQSKAEMQQEAERIRQETAQQIARLDAQAAQEIESAGKLARRDLKEYAAKLALELAEQRIRTGATAATESGMVDAFVADLGRQESKN